MNLVKLTQRFSLPDYWCFAPFNIKRGTSHLSSQRTHATSNKRSCARQHAPRRRSVLGVTHVQAFPNQARESQKLKSFAPTRMTLIASARMFGCFIDETHKCNRLRNVYRRCANDLSSSEEKYEGSSSFMCRRCAPGTHARAYVSIWLHHQETSLPSPSTQLRMLATLSLIPKTTSKGDWDAAAAMRNN